jgi:exodeoxyribonuclease VII large subunit
MARLPFDPSRAAGAKAEDDAAVPQRGGGKAGHLTVSQATQLIRETLEQRIPSPLRVVGEVSNLSTPGHWYFSIKDDAAVLNCVAWASATSKFGFTPKAGDEVVATGHISHFPPQGRTQMYVTKLEPVGAGALELRFRAMCEELRGLGYFDENRKKALPVFPRRIAVITSASGAAVQDVINTAAHRCKAVGLLIVDVRVQGEGAKEQIARAIRWVDANHARLGVDAMLVTRGGGSLEDLWAFNERIVADAAIACSIPIVAAIGHESDTTVIELVADVRASTPTQAAMRLVPDAAELHKQIAHSEQRLRFLLHRCVERRRERLVACGKALNHLVEGRVASFRSALERLAGRLVHLKPLTLVGHRHQRLAVMEDRLTSSLQRRFRRLNEHVHSLSCRLDAAMRLRVLRGRERIAAMERELIAIDPRHVLRRGFSYTTKRNGALVRSVGDVRSGDAMMTHVADGTIDSIVGERAKRRPSRAAGDASEQMDLFDSAASPH